MIDLTPDDVIEKMEKLTLPKSNGRTTISISKDLFYEFKRLRQKAGYSNEGLIRQMMRDYRQAELERAEVKRLRDQKMMIGLSGMDKGGN